MKRTVRITAYWDIPVEVDENDYLDIKNKVEREFAIEDDMVEIAVDNFHDLCIDDYDDLETEILEY